MWIASDRNQSGDKSSWTYTYFFLIRHDEKYSSKEYKYLFMSTSMYKYHIIQFYAQELFSSLQFSRSVVSNSLQPHESQHARPPCPSPTPGVHSNSWVSDAIQPSHPLFSPSPPIFNLFQQQGLFQWVRSSYRLANLLEFQLQHQSFQWIFRTNFL